MAKEIQTKLDGWTGFTITLAALATATARQSTFVTNTLNRPAALIFMKIESGAVAPTAGAIYELYLLRGDGTNRTDGAGASDAAITIQNAQMFGSLIVTATANAFFADEFDTAPLGMLGTQFGIAVKNVSGQALNGTEGNHLKEYNLYVPNITP